ncbi:rh121 [macacine betaherpesvirus 3]|uniref:Rh121 n=1 Tax=Rhesus cytomegalovirus (strain 68-1) TaxID=47929 RepID=Q7TFL6_RHCM6|nr:rh121 [macacine betaherpesvirus 3]AAP50647.1 rh121 [macacine betaherpesvirus 3]
MVRKVKKGVEFGIKGQVSYLVKVRRCVVLLHFVRSARHFSAHAVKVCEASGYPGHALLLKAAFGESGHSRVGRHASLRENLQTGRRFVNDRVAQALQRVHKVEPLEPAVAVEKIHGGGQRIVFGLCEFDFVFHRGVSPALGDVEPYREEESKIDVAF